MIKTIHVEITGQSPLLMHKFPLEPVEALEKKSIEEQAEYCAYRHPKTKELILPGIALQRAFVAGAAFSKGKGRGSLQKQAAACILIAPEYLSLGTKDYKIDSRPVVVPATRGRVLRHRPLIDPWQVTFELSYDDALLRSSEVRQIVDNTGTRVGVLDFRPSTKGPFGRFSVTSWKE